MVIKMNKLKTNISRTKKYIFLIVFIILASSIFVGLSTSGKLMRTTAESFLNKFDLEDIKLVSSHGIGDEELNLISDNLETSAINVGYQMDVGVEGTTNLITIESIPESWVKFDLKSGRFPEKPGEIAIDEDLDGFNNAIGDVITLNAKGDNPMMRLKTQKYTIVGKISSPEYILKSEKGISNFTGSTLDGYALILPEDFDLEKPNFARIHLNSTQNLSYFSNEYKAIVDNDSFKLSEAFVTMPEKKIEIVKKEASDRINKSTDRIKELEEERINNSKQNDINLEEIENKREEYNTKKKDFDDKLVKSQDLEKNGTNKQSKLKEEITLLEKNKSEIQVQYDQQAVKVDSAYSEFEPIQSEYESLKSNIDNRQIEIDNEYVSTNNRLAEISSEIGDLRKELSSIRFRSFVSLDDHLRARIDEINDAIENLQSESSNLEKRLSEINDLQKELDEDAGKLAGLESSYYQLQSNYESEKSILSDFRQSLDELNANLEKKEEEKNTLEKDIKDAKDFLKSQKEPQEKELSSMKTKLDEAEKIYSDKTNSYNKFMKDSENEIKNLKAVIERSKEEKDGKVIPTYDVESSAGNKGMDLYSSISERVDMMTRVFPSGLFIFSVFTIGFIYYSIITDRKKEINWQSITEDKELLKKLLAFTLSGLVVGLVLSRLLSDVIFKLYGDSFIFNKPDFKIFPIYLIIVIAGVLLALLIAILIEHFDIKTKLDLNINNKIVKNLFDHPIRLFGSILAIGSSACLLFLGLALSRSIRDIPDQQFNKIVRYHAEIQLPEKYDSKKLDDFDFFLTDVKKVRDIRDVAEYKASSIKDGYVSVDFDFIVPNETENFEVQMNLLNSNSERIEIPEDGIIISKKISELLNINKGDNLAFNLGDSKRYEAKVIDIFENYMSDYAYASPKSFKAITGENPIFTQKNIVLKDSSQFALENFVKEAAEYEYVQTVNTVIEAKADAVSIIKPLNFIAVLYIGVGIIVALLTVLMQGSFVMDSRLNEIDEDKKSILGQIQLQHFLQSLVGIFIGLMAGTGLFKLIIKETVRDNIRITSDIYWIDYVIVLVGILICLAFIYVQKSASYNKEVE